MKLQALTPLLGAGFTVATCYAAGSMLLGRLEMKLRRGEMFPLAFVSGAACVHLLLFAIFAMKIAVKPVLFAFEGLLILAAFLDHRKRSPEKPQPFDFSWSANIPALGYAALFVFFTALYFVNAWAPEVSADGPGYHLTLVAHYVRAHGFYPITTSMYAGLSEGAELLYALAFAAGRHSAAALVHFIFMFALTMMLAIFGLRIGKWWVGAGAALLVFFSPVVGKDGSSAYIDMAAAAAVFAVFYCLEIWRETGNDRILILVGLLSGYAYAVKYTAVFILIYAIAIVLWNRRRAAIKPICKICALAALMILPWMIKDWIYLQDPIAPVGAHIFRNANFNTHELDDWSHYLRRYDLTSFRQWPLEATIHGNLLQGPLGPVFLLAPLALLSLRNRLGARLLLAGFISLIPYPMNIGTRFLIPALPFIACALTLAIGKFPRAVSALVLIHATLSWPSIMGHYSTGWRVVHFPLQAALRNETEAGFLFRSLYDDDIARVIDERTPPGERVLSLSGLPTAYINHDVVISYESASGRILSDSLWTGYDPGFQPAVGLTFKFPEQSIQRIRVAQTGHASYPDQWDVTEIRFLNHGAELPRSPSWRLRSWPNPWYVQLAFDNSAVTCWRSGEGPSPGMWIETDFGAPQTLDQVEIEEPTGEMWAVALQVETLDSNGKWIKISENPQMHALKLPHTLRRQATYELYRHGFHYLVAHDDDFGAAEYLDDPDSWSMQIVGRTRSATLYKILP